MSQILSRVGPLVGGDGTTPAARAGRRSELIVGQGSGKYYEESSRQNIFVAATGSAGVATMTALSATAAMIALGNPAGSGVRLEILKVVLAYLSGTLGAGPVFHCLNNVAGQAMPVNGGGSAITPQCTDISNATDGSTVAKSGGNLPAIPTILYPFCSLFAELATTANGIQQVYEDVDGAICVEPGNIYSIESICGAGTAPLVVLGVVYRRAPL